MTIETPRLLLRPMRTDDVVPMLGLFGHSRFMAAFDAERIGMSLEGTLVRNGVTHRVYAMRLHA